MQNFFELLSLEVQLFLRGMKKVTKDTRYEVKLSTTPIIQSIILCVSLNLYLTLKSSKDLWTPVESIKIFNVYRDLKASLEGVGVGAKKGIPIEAQFPPSFASSSLGMSLSEDQLRQR